jgi:hypothetical protein
MHAKALGLDPQEAAEEYIARITWKGYQKD